MKYLSVVFLFVFILIIPGVSAVNSEVDAGVLPGGVFYAFDLFFERIHLLFTFGLENKADVLLSFAKERELELSALNDDKKERFSEELMNRRENYIMQVRDNLEDSDIDEVSRQNILQDIDNMGGSESSADVEVVLVDMDDVILSDENNSDVIEQKEEPEISKPIVKLSELQETACNAAEIGNTCDTRLSDLGLVTKEECCVALGECC